ncbi:MAG TPA: glycosyltransferase family 4 protein [bacterium]|mgnify:CR=1 FL=1|nr:glycosyltransferase family 4 protein [bacterium]
MSSPASQPISAEWDTALAANCFLYEALCEQFERQKLDDPEKVASSVAQLANFAAGRHPGCFADGRIENRLLPLADAVDRAERIPIDSVVPGRPGRPRVLHVASQVFQSGGHTRVLAKWIDKDPASHHLVVLTEQPVPVPEILLAACARQGGQIFNLPRKSSQMSRARAVRELAGEVDRVVLHHHCGDAVVVLALAITLRSPVAYFCHSPFFFGLGPTVADLTLNTIPYFRRLTERFRFPRATALLPGVGCNQPFVSCDKEQAKKALNLEPRAPVLLTSGWEHYFRPALGYDFFRTLKKVLKACGNVQVLVVGPRPDADFVPRELAADPRVRFSGIVSDPVPYYHAADLCLESFPRSSLGGHVEAVAYGGAFPIPVYGPHENLWRLDRPPLCDVSPRPTDEAHYVQTVAERVEGLSESRALAAKLQGRLQALDRQWPAVLQNVYAQLDASKHSPGPIPAAEFSDTEDNHLLAAYDPPDLWAELHKRFPYGKALKLNAVSITKGLQPACRVLAREGRHACAAVKKAFEPAKKKYYRARIWAGAERRKLWRSARTLARR